MKLQLTRTKAIEIALPGGKRTGSGGASSADIVGVELFAPAEEGCPAIRLARRKNRWQLLAADLVPAPASSLPEKWEDMPKQPRWELPAAFQSPHAALVVNSSQALFAQATGDSIAQDMARGISTSYQAMAGEPAAEKKRFAVRRPEKSAAAEPANAKRPELPPAGVPTSSNGMRFVIKPAAEDGFHLAAALPEFQALWLSRLLPEGRRPTASSIQVREAALMASILAQPAFQSEGGNALAVFVGPSSIHFAGYKGGQPVLWRRCPSVAGYQALRNAVMRGLGVEEALVESVLDDTLIDPRSVLEPFLHPVFDELELARAYLADRHALTTSQILLAGLPAGAGYWQKCAQESHQLDLHPLAPFEGIEVSAHFKSSLKEMLTQAQQGIRFLPALGAALAAAEVNI